MSNVQLSDDMDKMVWKLNKNGLFTIKSYYMHLVKRDVDNINFLESTNMEGEGTTENCIFRMGCGSRMYLYH